MVYEWFELRDKFVTERAKRLCELGISISSGLMAIENIMMRNVVPQRLVSQIDSDFEALAREFLSIASAYADEKTISKIESSIRKMRMHLNRDLDNFKSGLISRQSMPLYVKNYKTFLGIIYHSLLTVIKEREKLELPKIVKEISSRLGVEFEPEELREIVKVKKR